MAMDFWATIEHSLQYKYRHNMPEHIREKLLNAANATVALDQEMSSVRGEIMDAQNSFNYKASIVADILTNIQNLYYVGNQREVVKIQNEFYDIYQKDDLEKLEDFSKQLDIIAEGYKAQGFIDYELTRSHLQTGIKTQLGDDYDAYMNCLDQGMHHGLRVNTNKISVEDFLKISPFELKPVPWTTNGFYYDDKACTPSKHPYYYAGLYYIQEPSAMAPASILPVEDGDVVLDICAAPGGKSTELAAKLHGTGFLISNDISNSRAKALLKNLELFGIGNMCVVSEAPNKLSTKFYQTFDKILIDAPCSGEGMFRKSQSMVTAWENNGVELFAGLQRGILNEVVKMLKPVEPCCIRPVRFLRKKMNSQSNIFYHWMIH